MNLMVGFEIIYTTLIILSVWLISIPKRSGLFVMITGQFLAIPVFYSKGLYFAVGLMLVLNVINIKAIINWRKKGVGE
jgi:hypothetical protein